MKPLYRRIENFVDNIRTLTGMPHHTDREEDLWYIAKDLHKYMSQLDAQNLKAFSDNLLSIIDMANLFAEHAGGLRRFPEQSSYILEEDE